MSVTFHFTLKVPNSDDVYCEGECLSSDIKPVRNVANGSKLMEMDTSSFYLFDKDNKEWREWE